jgi:MoxR-like ATPase
MTVSVNRQTQASPDTMVDPVFEAWSELKTYLERRSKELSDEVRSYPTPIARCDEQLTKLIEQRAAAIDQLKLVLEAAPVRSGRTDPRQLAALEAYLMRPQALPDDETETALRLRLRTALSQLRGMA